MTEIDRDKLRDAALDELRAHDLIMNPRPYLRDSLRSAQPEGGE